jgi:hypothetical protein
MHIKSSLRSRVQARYFLPFFLIFFFLLVWPLVFATVTAASCANDWSTVVATTRDVLTEAPLPALAAGKLNCEDPDSYIAHHSDACHINVM